MSDRRGSGPDAKTSDGRALGGRAKSPRSSDRPDPHGRGGSSGPTWRRTVYDVATSAGAVFAVGLLLFAVSGVWPPLVAIESGSMEPHIHTGDLVFVMDEARFPGDGAHANTGVVTAERGAETGYRSFQGPGDVIVFQPGGDPAETPVIHRAMFWVEEGERWYDRANPRYVGSNEDCGDLTHCPAPHAGFITKGDDNPVYDQVGNGDGSEPVRPAWVLGTAEYRVPLLGWLRLEVRGAVAGGSPVETVGSPSSGSATLVANETGCAAG